MKITKRTSIRDSPDWPVPDGTNPSQYPKPDEVSLTQWRWEVLRRDTDYRNEWRQFRRDSSFSISVQGDPDDEAFDMPYYPEEHEDRWDDIWRILRKYGLTRLLDPSVGSPKHLRFHFVPFAPDVEDDPLLRLLGVQSISWKLQYPYLAWFQLWKPIEPQLQHYAEVLKREQNIARDAFTSKTKSFVETELEVMMAIQQGKSPDPKTIKKLRSPAMRDRYSVVDQWPKFLRVLDAEQHAVLSWGRIGREVCKFRSNFVKNAKADYKAATNLWWKIPVERSIPPVYGMEDADWEAIHSVIPPLPQGSRTLRTWLDLLHPKLSKLLLSSLS